MKLSRNKIKKIRKQQHQSVRKWKKQYKSSARRSTFRQSRRQNLMGVITKYSPKLNNVMNRTLKKYISESKLKEVKELYKRLRRQRRKQKRYNMKGGMVNTPTTANTAARTSNPSNTGKNQPFSLGISIKGDISIGTETHECKTQNETYKLVQFLIEKGLPYYLQIELKSGEKPLNKNDTNIFDLRRILYGRFAQDIKNIAENKRQLYLEQNETVGVANGSILGDEQSGFFIYTGEKGQILPASSDTAINVRLLQDDHNAQPMPPLTDSTRLYKLKGKGPDVKPAAIDSMKFLSKIDSTNKIETSEFRLQVAPMTEDELNKDAQNIASGNNDPEVKVVVDESNTYVVNLSIGCRITSIQTLKKSLEKARSSLENEKDQSKQSAMDIFKKINALLQNPEFMKSDGYGDFKESVFGFSYKIRGSERKYGFTQIQTFFEDKKDNIPKHVIKEFFKTMDLLGHGPGGSNGDCLRFDGASPSLYELSRIQTFEQDGKIVTKKTETLDSASNLNGFMKQLSKVGEMNKGKEEEENKNENPEKPEEAAATSETGVEGTDVNSPPSASPAISNEKTASNIDQDKKMKLVAEVAAAAAAAAVMAAMKNTS